MCMKANRGLSESHLCVSTFPFHNKIESSGRKSSATLSFHEIYITRVVGFPFISSNMLTPRTYKTLILVETIAAIKEVEKGMKEKSEIAKNFGIPPKHVYIDKK